MRDAILIVVMGVIIGYGLHDMYIVLSNRFCN